MLSVSPTKLVHTVRSLLGLLLVGAVGSHCAVEAQEPVTPAVAPPRPEDEEVMEAVFVDEGMLKLKVKLETLVFVTPYGRLTIPLRDIERVDFGRRVSSDLNQQIEARIKDLGNGEFQIRENAGAELLKLGFRAYPALVQATGSNDKEVATRAETLLETLRQTVPKEQLEIPDVDVVQTKDSKLTGHVDGPDHWTAVTAQFGEVKLRLAELRQLRIPGMADDEPSDDVVADPGNLSQPLGLGAVTAGKTLQFRVTGRAGGIVWGADPYTVDSQLATAAVHAGVLRPGQTGVVYVQTVGIQADYAGSTRNGIQSQPFGQFPGFKFIKRRTRAGR